MVRHLSSSYSRLDSIRPAPVQRKARLMFDRMSEKVTLAALPKHASCIGLDPLVFELVTECQPGLRCESRPCQSTPSRIWLPSNTARLQAPLIRRPQLLRPAGQYMRLTAKRRERARTLAPNCTGRRGEATRSGEVVAQDMNCDGE
jgi:hypothetical protein